MALAMKLNGLLASPSFAAWGMGSALDIQSMLYTADGTARCAIVTTAHLSDEERQFVTSLVLSKLVTWMRRQSGTTDLRALLYMDEVAGYLPPTANPPTKKPIMLLMKQARAFGVGVVLTTQNPVDVDYKALSNAGTWMIGRLQTDRDKQRLLDGMSSASGGVDIAAVGDTISGLAKREFVLRRAGKDHPEVFTTRWAMSYLRGPLTRDQIASQRSDASVEAAGAADGRTGSSPLNDADRRTTDNDAPVRHRRGQFLVDRSDTSPVMPEVADGVAVRWVDVAAPWLGDVGGDPRGTVLAPAIVARVSLRYDESKADLVHDAEYEAVIFPLARGGRRQPCDRRRSRRPRPAHRSTCECRLPSRRRADRAPSRSSRASSATSSTISRRSLALDVPTNAELKLFARPGETIGRVRGPLRPARGRTRRRGDRQAPRQVRVEGDDAAASDRERRGSRRRARRGGERQAQLRDAVDRRIDPRWAARRAQVAGRAAGFGPRQGRICRRASRSQPRLGGASGRGARTRLPGWPPSSRTSRPSSPKS